MSGILKSTVSVTGGTNIVGSPNVFVNDKPAVRIGDSVLPHGRRQHNTAVMATGSSTVFANSIPVSRNGDIANCGHSSAGGSSDVFAGG